MGANDLLFERLIIMPDSAVLTLREEKLSADSCGDPFLEKPVEGLLPVGCGAEAVFNFSWEKEILSYGSGDDSDYQWPTTAGTIVIPTRSLLSTAAHHRTTRGIISVTPNRSATRLPPRFTPSPENRHSSFQHLLRLHLNTFNQRLSMLERNTLDMKESIHTMEDQQNRLSSQLKELIALQSASEKNKKVTELEKSYTDMETRLSRLEGRLEILIDGFTALAQEMNKMKRARHTSRSPQEKRALPSIATVLVVPSYSTPQPPVRTVPTEKPLTSRATVPKSIPTPGLPANKPTSFPRRERKLKPAATTPSVKPNIKPQSVTRSSRSQVSTRSPIKLRTTLSKPRTTLKSQATAKPETKRPQGRRPNVTAKRLSQPNKTKPVQVKKEETVTKFQLEPPSHKPTPAKPDQTKKKDSASPVKNNRRNKAFRSDAPVPKQVQEGGEPSEGDSKKSSKPHNGNISQNAKKTEPNSYKLVSQRTKNSTKNTITTTKPTKAIAVKKPNTAEKKKSTPPTTKPTTVKKKSNTTVKRKSTPPKTKATTAKKVTKKPQQKKKSNSGVLDLLQLLHGRHKPAKQKKNQDGSLHVVLGRLAIPIKIIPDY